MKKVRWGVLSTAKIAREKVIPAMQQGALCEVTAIASRNEEQAKAEAARLNIPKAYGSYEELVNDQEIDAVYIPLPNHMHVPWTIKALEAEKHVLCEKPVALSSAEAKELLQAAQQKPHLKVMEAFMYRFHPQWRCAKKLVDEGRIGELRTIQSFFSYFNIDPKNIRNRKEAGGGAMMDIGCYCVSFPRFIFDKEPEKVFGFAGFDPALQTDRIASGIMNFSNGTSTFTCSTQMMPFQRVNILGTAGRIEIEMPVNALPDKPSRIWLHKAGSSEEILFDAVDQYTLQGDAFSKCILENTEVPTPLEDAVSNMKVIESIFKSSGQGSWIDIE